MMIDPNRCEIAGTLRHRPRPTLRGMAAALAALGLLAWAGAGCATLQTGAGDGGIAGGDGARISAVVAQTRAQFPKLSAPGIPYAAREAPGKTPLEAARLVLKGGGVGVSPGIQVAAKVPLELELYLEKPGYNAGYAKLSINHGTQNIWRIVAYERRGRADEEFEFIYALASPRGELWYLAVIGGGFEEGDTGYFGIEGTLVVPGKEGGIAAWKRAYKIDFGSRAPLPPAYQTMVEEAGELFGRLRKRLPELESLERRSRRSQAQLDLLRHEPPGRDGGAGTTAAINEEQARLKELRARQGQEAEGAERELLRYFQLRNNIAAAYAEFTRGNAYTWATETRQQRFYDAWKEVELHHPRIDELSDKLAPLLKGRAQVERGREEAMREVKRHNNWDKDPSRPAERR